MVSRKRVSKGELESNKNERKQVRRRIDIGVNKNKTMKG